MVEIQRVDCVKIHKRGSEEFDKRSSGKDTVTVFDLTVFGHPSFYANDMLVHNCVDQDEASAYNNYEYTKIKITNEMVLEHGDEIVPLLDLPASHKQYKNVWIGMDVGYTNDPSVLVVFGEEPPSKKGEEPRLKMIANIVLERISNPSQVKAILHLIGFYNPKAFSMDKTGVGLPLFQDVQQRVASNPKMQRVVDTIKGYNFSEKILVDIDESIEIDEFKGDAIRDAGVKRNVLEYSSDKLRQLVDQKRVLLPFDKELLKEFNGQTFSYKSELDMYGRRKSYSTGQYHTLDATRMATLGYVQAGIEQMQKLDKEEIITSIFLW